MFCHDVQRGRIASHGLKRKDREETMEPDIPQLKAGQSNAEYSAQWMAYYKQQYQSLNQRAALLDERSKQLDERERMLYDRDKKMWAWLDDLTTRERSLGQQQMRDRERFPPRRPPPMRDRRDFSPPRDPRDRGDRDRDRDGYRDPRDRGDRDRDHRGPGVGPGGGPPQRYPPPPGYPFVQQSNPSAIYPNYGADPTPSARPPPEPEYDPSSAGYEPTSPSYQPTSSQKSSMP